MSKTFNKVLQKSLNNNWIRYFTGIDHAYNDFSDRKITEKNLKGYFKSFPNKLRLGLFFFSPITFDVMVAYELTKGDYDTGIKLFTGNLILKAIGYLYANHLRNKDNNNTLSGSHHPPAGC